MDSRFLKAEEIVNQYEQGQLLRFVNSLSGEERNRLAEQILHVDFEQLASIWKDNANASADTTASISPIPFVDWDKLPEKEQRLYTEAGWQLLRDGKVGAIVVAGGQGSRLGHNGPKGAVDIGLPTHKSLFQLQAERLLNLSNRANHVIPWYIMTSPDNHKETVGFFRAADYFGYPEEDCIFFQQNTMPAVDHEGKLILSSASELNLVPSGNGECFSSLKRSGALADMKRRGLSWLFYCNVDNALIKMADPSFVGIAAAHNNPIATKVIEKTSADEKVGTTCIKNGRPTVVEYTEIPKAVLEATDSHGQPLYGMGNISIHMFRYDFIERHAGSDMPFHIASKIIPYIDAKGEIITPSAPNAYKLERFIFDYFPLADKVTVVKVKREEEFAPVKNKEGEDSPATARQLLLSLHTKWLMSAGLTYQGLTDQEIEISPLRSYSGEGLEEG